MRQYDPKEVNITWNGIILNEGIAEGTFVTATRTSRTWTLSVGSDGEATRVRSNDKSGSITITLRQGSAVNRALTDMAEADELAQATVGPLSISDASGKSTVIANQAFIEGLPDWTRGNEEGTVEWVLLSDNVTFAHFGNAEIGG